MDPEKKGEVGEGAVTTTTGEKTTIFVQKQNLTSKSKKQKTKKQQLMTLLITLITALWNQINKE